MFALRAAPQLVSKAGVLAQASRNMTVISGPPKNRISTAEKMAHAVVITTALLAYPAWVLVHIREYRGMA